MQDMKLQRLESGCDEPPRASASQSRDSLNILVESIPSKLCKHNVEKVGTINCQKCLNI